MQVHINFIAVIVATLSAMVIGYIWYHPKVLGGRWLRLSKINPKKGDMAWGMTIALISALVMATVLAFFTYLYSYFFLGSYFINAVSTALLIWFGFQGLRVLQRDAFNQRRKKESLIHIGNDLVTIIVMGVIIGLFGV